MIRVRDIAFRTWTIPLVRPFRFGVAELRELRHLLVRCAFDIDGDRADGYAGENLAPKWFTKDPATTLEQDVAKLDAAVRDVAAVAPSLAADSAFDLWHCLTREACARLGTLPALVRQLGVSLVERCAIDAACRRAARPFHELLRDGSLGLAPEPVYPDLRLRDIAAALPSAPPRHIAVRHTVGLSDPLEALPEILARGGIGRLKIKLSGDADDDVERLGRIAECVDRAGIGRITLDGNENYASPAALRPFLARLRAEPALAAVRRALAWVEQPLHRDAALADEVAPLLVEFPQFPHVMDESDDDASRLPRALALGYAGTTYKACKGVFKGVLAAALLHRHAHETGRKTLLSGEDLTIVAPWSQTQDLAAAAAIGVIDVERNGHHYADGLNAFPPPMADAAAAEHPALYACGAGGAVNLRLNGGVLDLSSVNAAPFGSAAAPAFDLLDPA